jgi:hypothetical protein
MSRSRLRFAFRSQAREERTCGAPSDEVQDGPIKQKTDCPKGWRVATIKNDIVSREPGLASENREQRSEQRRLPGELDDDTVANQLPLTDIDVGGCSNRSRRAPVTDRKLEVRRDTPQVRAVGRRGHWPPEPGEVCERRDDPIEIYRAEPADEQRHRGEVTRGEAMHLH